MREPTLAITTGEPAGIGPEISLRAALAVDIRCTLLGDAALLAGRARALGIAWPLPARVSIE
ncbi:MAG: 4-hydroxythreonine-4-phosphate dehydrogenase PdxA, partial [Gemmatimonadota bacterium]